MISSFSPTLLVLGILEISKTGLGLEPISCIVAFILLSLLGWLILLGAESEGEALNINLKKIEPNDSLVIPFVVTFIPSVLRALNVDLMAVQGCLLGLFMLGLVVSYIPIHPVLRMFGYRFYKSETEGGSVVTIIAQREVRDKDSIKSVVKISENLFIERKTRN